MMTHAQLHAALDRMEASLAETRSNLIRVEHALRNRAEAETIRRRPKARYYHRRMSRWTGADEAEYRRILGRLLETSGPELNRLHGRIARQDAAIEALRSKYRINAKRLHRPAW
ncbi:hypothetical protein NO932_16580 [Pelagibacterium sp. 26DY04]|uniref:hypothetical protein n=1 Tax=Pelagibacterium sp. 26DY04 TaxID=2967130 RepID=UPI00281597B4|nr:hypothetical protein [Pelagibacterium sp. 26DY04]WMT86508.1 hypothetical protein NO932_16580 [Pelagibacterium sp. 26DY04]